MAENLTGVSPPVQVVGWDGSVAGSQEPVVRLRFRSRAAVRAAVWPPHELGLARAYVSGLLDVEPIGDRDVVTALSDPRLMRFATAARSATRSPIRALACSAGAIRLGGLGHRLRRPPEEAILRGRRHDRGRDAVAIAHHYDLGNDFYRLLLGESMVYSCAYWRNDPGDRYTLADAQRDKLERVCRKLGLVPGARLLDVGCGWGSLVLHAAACHGVRAVGVTLSRAQAELARLRVSSAGLQELVDIRVQDYRDLTDGPYDAVASVGMAEHLGRRNYPTYANVLGGLLRPGGRLLHHQITVPEPAPRRGRRGFIDRYIFPDGELAAVGFVAGALERAGLEILDVESLREHYVPTLQSWLENLDSNRERAVALSSPARVRAWRLYLAASAAGFAGGRMGVHQLLAGRRLDGGRSAVPRLRSGWLPGG
jgi:cyclopropane-fatty-acyl-phospholipid synthase